MTDTTTEVRGALRLLLALTILVAGLGLAATPAAAAPVLVALPATGLLDQQIVTVTGTGFSAGEELLVTQCIGAVPTSCAMDPLVNRNGAYAVADQTGAVSVTLRLPRQLVLPAGQTGGSCADGNCSIVAIARADTAERARIPIDFEPTGDAPGYPAGTTQITTVAAGAQTAVVDVSGSGFQPWFLVQPYAFDGGDLPISGAEEIRSRPGAYLSVCPHAGLTPGFTHCTRVPFLGTYAPGQPSGGRAVTLSLVEPDGTVPTDRHILQRIYHLDGNRIDCAVEDCRFVLEQDAPIGEPQAVDWAPEWHPWPGVDAFIDHAYDTLMGREPTTSERSTATAGLTDRSLTGRAFLMGLAARPDGRRVAELVRLYRATLDRLPETAGLTYWAGELAGNGGSMSAIARAFGRTSEFRTSFGSGSNATVVARAYQRTLGRTSAPFETAYWVGRLEAGMTRPQLIHHFTRTAEFLVREAARSQVTAVIHGMAGWIVTSSQWSYMDIDRDLEDDPPHAWRIDATLLQFLGGYSVD